MPVEGEQEGQIVDVTRPGSNWPVLTCRQLAGFAVPTEGHVQAQYLVEF
jgi:hypothetical protein